MKGYHTENGYMGYVDGEYQLFASEADYAEWMEEQRKNIGRNFWVCNNFTSYDILGYRMICRSKQQI